MYLPCTTTHHSHHPGESTRFSAATSPNRYNLHHCVCSHQPCDLPDAVLPGAGIPGDLGRRAGRGRWRAEAEGRARVESESEELGQHGATRFGEFS